MTLYPQYQSYASDIWTEGHIAKTADQEHLRAFGERLNFLYNSGRTEATSRYCTRPTIRFDKKVGDDLEEGTR